jgi:predicted enzyme related to lactoylglutathione lyase
MINSIAFFSYVVKDVARARKFYETSLGLTVGMNFQDQWVEYEVAGQTFAITNMDTGHQAGVKGGMVAFEVDDFDKAIVRLKATQTKFVLEKYDTPVCNFAIVTDPDGNEIMIHRRKSVS